MIVEHLAPDLVQAVPRFPEERDLAGKAFPFQELRDPAIEVRLWTHQFGCRVRAILFQAPKL